ncbi:MAG: HTH domain-containing protein, partial [Planctomycetes bacterium]|nr:HTH domain-containing protein [Planctomycetota bacterium]
MTGAAVPGRQTRMLKILSRLQAGGGLNATQLADQLEVCRRTIFRDLSLMREAGVSVYYDGVTDCYRLSPNGDLMV